LRKNELRHKWTPWTLVVLRGPTPQVGPTPQGQIQVRTMTEECQKNVRTKSEQGQNKLRTRSEHGKINVEREMLNRSVLDFILYIYVHMLTFSYSV
jgi:hypothetical protein